MDNMFKEKVRVAMRIHSTNQLDYFENEKIKKDLISNANPLDFIFDVFISQETFFTECIKSKIDDFFNGINS
jgi:hypothetical protein